MSETTWIERYRNGIRCRVRVGVPGLERHIEELESQCLMLAKLASDTPQFSNPLHVWEAQILRDEILARSRKGV